MTYQDNAPFCSLHALLWESRSVRSNKRKGNPERVTKSACVLSISSAYASEGIYAPLAKHPTQVYFGDPHLHTSLSMDAGAWGNNLGLDQAYVTTRRHWERIYEATQIKGDGEAHPFLSPHDEFADYETWDLGNLDSSFAKTNDMLDVLT